MYRGSEPLSSRAEIREYFNSSKSVRPKLGFRSISLSQAHASEQIRPRRNQRRGSPVRPSVECESRLVADQLLLNRLPRAIPRAQAEHFGCEISGPVVFNAGLRITETQGEPQMNGA